jgi:leucine dehydrogenase
MATQQQVLNKKIDSSSKKSELLMEYLPIAGYEKVIKITHPQSKLQAIIAIHNTSLGMALGGTRMFPYTSFDQALTDVLRLSKGMTYKSAVAGTGFGGGKGVIIGDPKSEKTEELLLAYAEAIESLQGEFITAEDSGTTMEDLKIMRKKTKYLVGLPHEKSSGNPSRYTAWGTYRGIQSALKKIYGSSNVENRKIVVQGVGSVGEFLVDFLFWAGAEVVISDINVDQMKRVAKKYSLKMISTDEVYHEECDVLAPCALGGIINNDTIPILRCKAIAGCANNQLHMDDNANDLKERNILYAPDFVINAGGLINVSQETKPEGYNPKDPQIQTHKIYDTLMAIYEISSSNSVTTLQAALSLAEYRMKYGIGKRKENPYFHHN